MRAGRLNPRRPQSPDAARAEERAGDAAGAAIAVEGLTKRFGQFLAVDHVTFSVPRGQVFGFLGPNGAGKTTTIRVLLGLLAPTSGMVRVLGLDLPRQARRMHSRVGYMSQLFTLYDDLTPRENIRFYGQAYGLNGAAVRRSTEEVIAQAGLHGREDELTAGLSGGWRQRLALGCAILHHPELVFLDEPTAGVDPVSRREFWDLIYRLALGGVTVFVTTHYMDEAEHCQRLGFISQGRLVALGSPGELKATQMHGEILEVVCNDADAALRLLRAATASCAPTRSRCSALPCTWRQPIRLRHRTPSSACSCRTAFMWRASPLCRRRWRTSSSPVCADRRLSGHKVGAVSGTEARGRGRP